MDNKSNNKTEMMEIEIKFNKGKTDRVLVHYGDDPEDLAKEFVQRHSLKPASVVTIAKYISTTIENFCAENPRESTSTKQESVKSLEPSREDTSAHSTIPNASVSAQEPVRNASKSNQEKSPKASFSYENRLSNLTEDGSVEPRLTDVQNDSQRETLVSAAESGRSEKLLISRQSSNSFGQETSVRSRPSSVNLSKMGRTASDYNLNNILSIKTPEYYLESVTPSVSTKGNTPDVSTTLHPLSERAINRIKGPDGFTESFKLDHRQYQEIFDRNMDFDNFSVDKLAGEILASKALAEHKTISPRTSYAQRNSISVSEVPETDIESSPVRVKISPKANRDRRTSDVSFAAGYDYDSSVKPLPSLDEYINTDNMNSDYSNEAAREYDQDEADFVPSYDVEDRSDSEDSSQRRLEKKLSQEDIYNKLKKSWTLNRKETTLDASNLKPVAQIMRMSSKQFKNVNNNSTKSTSSSSLIGKTANERLYISAKVKKDKQERLENNKNNAIEKMIKENQYKLNPESQRLVKNLQLRNRHMDVGQRLHDEALKELQAKAKREKAMKNVPKPDDWSCARCGLFHEAPPKNIYSKGPSTDKLYEKICSNCGWNQGNVEPFKPTNIGLQLSEDATEILKRESRGDIYNYLHSSAKQRETAMKLNQIMWEEHDLDLSFKPTIPESSLQILSKYLESDPNLENMQELEETTISDLTTDQLPSDKVNGASTSSGNQGNRKMLTGKALKEYLSKSAMERLTATSHRSVDADNSKLKKSQSKVNSTDGSVKPTKTADKVNKCVERLLADAEEKKMRMKEKEEEYYKYDPKTKQKLFQPKLPDTSELQTYGAASLESVYHKQLPHGKDFVEDLLRRDKELAKKKRLAEVKAQQSIQQQMVENRVKASEKSEQILSESRERSIEELFRLLLVSNFETKNSSNDPVEHARQLSALSEDLTDWNSQKLNLVHIKADMMIPEVITLIAEVTAEKIAYSKEKNISNEDERFINVSYKEFRSLVLRCIRKRDGVGKGYIYAPKKKPELAMQLALKAKQEETFKPNIDRRSLQLSQNRTKTLNDLPIEDVLLAEGDRIKMDRQSAIEEKRRKEALELTFKPKLYKTPSHITPRYKGMSEEMMRSMDEDEGEYPEFADFSTIATEESSDGKFDEDDQDPTSVPPPPPLLNETQKQTSSSTVCSRDTAKSSKSSKFAYLSVRPLGGTRLTVEELIASGIATSKPVADNRFKHPPSIPNTSYYSKTQSKSVNNHQSLTGRSPNDISHQNTMNQLEVAASSSSEQIATNRTESFMFHHAVHSLDVNDSDHSVSTASRTIPIKDKDKPAAPNNGFGSSSRPDRSNSNAISSVSTSQSASVSKGEMSNKETSVIRKSSPQRINPPQHREPVHIIASDSSVQSSITFDDHFNELSIGKPSGYGKSYNGSRGNTPVSGLTKQRSRNEFLISRSESELDDGNRPKTNLKALPLLPHETKYGKLSKSVSEDLRSLESSSYGSTYGKGPTLEELSIASPQDLPNTSRVGNGNRVPTLPISK